MTLAGSLGSPWFSPCASALPQCTHRVDQLTPACPPGLQTKLFPVPPVDWQIKMAAPVARICRRCICSEARKTKPLVGRPRPHIDRIIRVDHAGELGADRIYAGQMAVLGRTNVGPTIQVA